MILRNNQNGRLKSKYQLKQELQRYQSILNKSSVEYLEQLVELDFSVIRKNTSDEERILLSQLEIYRDVSIYNIYHRAIQLLEKSEIQSLLWDKICESPIMIDTLAATIPCSDLFKFNFESNISKTVPNGYLDRQIGTISLYQSIENGAARKREINNLLQWESTLEKEQNPFLGISDAQAMKWSLAQGEKIEKHRLRVNELNSMFLTETAKKSIEYTNYISELFMKDYGLTEEDFIEYTSKHKLTEMEKVYVINMPNLQIKREVHYL